jgi:heme/copper-type cytochrome/quinol oxidase subunit 2
MVWSGALSPLAQVQWQSVQDMKNGIGTMAGILVIVSWLLALIAWYVGASTRDNNPAVSKYCFYVVWMFAIGGPVVSLVFYLFVGASGTPTPTF